MGGSCSLGSYCECESGRGCMCVVRVCVCETGVSVSLVGVSGELYGQCVCVFGVCVGSRCVWSVCVYVCVWSGCVCVCVVGVYVCVWSACMSVVGVRVWLQCVCACGVYVVRVLCVWVYGQCVCRGQRSAAVNCLSLPQLWDSKHMLPHLAFYGGYRGSNSNPNVCTASTISPA